MLTQSKQFEGKLVEASLEPACRGINTPGPGPNTPGNFGFEETRFKLVIDELDNPIAAVTDQYTLVKNRELIAAVDLVADELGITLEPQSGIYHNGHSRYEIGTPDMEFKATGDPSFTTGRIIVENDYRGNGGIRLMTGWFRLICSNGLIVGKIASESNTRHVGEIDIIGKVREALGKFLARFEVDTLLAETLAKESFDFTGWPGDREIAQHNVEEADPYLIDRILADTAERYQGEFRAASRRNSADMGETLWALAQTVSEVATHTMNGRFSPDDWAHRQLSRIAGDVGITI